MDNFDLKKYLAEGKLLKEDITQFEEYIEGMFNAAVGEEEGFQTGVWTKEEEGNPEIYDETEKFDALVDYLANIGGKATLEGNPDIELELLPKGDIKWSADVTLAEGKLLNEFIGGDLQKRNQALYDKLVPGSGAADTVEGEMLRAINRIIYRYYNDGDYYYEGYGTETAGPAHSYLVNSKSAISADLNRIFDESRDEEYEQMLNKALGLILDYIEKHEAEGYSEPNSEDMFDYEPEFEDEEEDDDWDDYHGGYGYDDEDEDEDY